MKIIKTYVEIKKLFIIYSKNKNKINLPKNYNKNNCVLLKPHLVPIHNERFDIYKKNKFLLKKKIVF